MLGAFVLTSFGGDQAKPIVTTYLAVIGSWLLYWSFHRIPTNPAKLAIVAPLGVTAEFLDAAGVAPRSAICTALVSDRFQPLG